MADAERMCMSMHQARGNASTKGLVVDYCDHTTVRNLTIYHAGSFALFQQDGTNNSFM